jgi:hypothetical protein
MTFSNILWPKSFGASVDGARSFIIFAAVWTIGPSNPTEFESL